MSSVVAMITPALLLLLPANSSTQAVPVCRRSKAANVWQATVSALGSCRLSVRQQLARVPEHYPCVTSSQAAVKHLDDAHDQVDLVIATALRERKPVR